MGSDNSKQAQNSSNQQATGSHAQEDPEFLRKQRTEALARKLADQKRE